jgi:enamine deaminase RidA (YjgF/YER057c/UK114 family)
MIKQVIKPAGGAPAVGPYSPAVRLGNLLFCSLANTNSATTRLREWTNKEGKVEQE